MKTILAPTKETALAYRNDAVIERIAQDNNLTQEQAESIFMDTLRFLWVASVADGPVSPTKAIDKGWHAFILFTRDYAHYCEQHLGQMIHHQPHTAAIKSKAGYKRRCTETRTRTFDVARREFGASLSANWNFGVRNDVCSTDCCDEGGVEDCEGCAACTADCG